MMTKQLKSTSPFSQHAMFVCVLSTSLLLASCGSDKPGSKQSGQSIVRVNSEEITVHQINDSLQKSQVDPASKDQAAKKIVENLIERSLLVQAAMDQKLDRNPQVMTAIENSKQQILAQAYLQSKVSNVAEPTDAEILKYRDENKNVFANRKLYAMEQLSFPIDASLIKSLEKLSDEATSLDQVIAWLNDKGIQFSRDKKVLAAENLPKKLLDKMSAMQNNELIFVNGKNSVMVGRLLETKLQPISVEDSKPLIKQALVNVKKAEAAKAEMERLKQSANIVYLDERYNPATNSPTKASEAVADEVKTEPKEPTSKEDKIAEQVEKGLSGL